MTTLRTRCLVMTGLLLTFFSLPSLGEDAAGRRRSRSGEQETAGRASHQKPHQALSNDTIGPSGMRGDYRSPAPQTVIPSGSYSLSIDGDFKLGGIVFKDGSPFLHNDGGPSANNTAIGLNALISSTPGSPYSHSGRRNTALGSSALRYNTLGWENTAIGFLALEDNYDGARNTAIGAFALYNNTSGSRNTAAGLGALSYNSEGSDNTAIGESALGSNTLGINNTASGRGALSGNKEGSSNTAIGAWALRYNYDGDRNTAIGIEALWENTSGYRNTAIGAFALHENTGSRNIAVGDFAGYSGTTGSDNIWIGNYGSTGESNTLRIGQGTGTGALQQDRAFISGIRSATLSMTDPQVCIDASDQLGLCNASSLRFKEEIQEMAEASDAVFRLRPVRFRYKQDLAGEDERPVQYGLIAEDVAEVYPTLVTRDAEGRPVAIRYDALTPLLLNELQKQQLTSAKQQAMLREQATELTALSARLAALEKLLDWLDRPRRVADCRPPPPEPLPGAR